MATHLPPQIMARLMLVEDDTRLAALTREYLQQQGFAVTIIERGDEAVSAVLQHPPDLLILDIMLPGLDGLEVCRHIRPGFSNPILMLTARDEDLDQIIGLELGADDYVTKPVQPRVLLARINALLRRSRVKPELQVSLKTVHQSLRFGQLLIKPTSRQVSLDQRAVSLTTNEFELLWLLAQHPGQILGREQILSSLRGIDYDGLDRWVDIRISRLRHKLGDDAQQPFRIKTVWGKGYLFVEDAWA